MNFDTQKYENDNQIKYLKSLETKDLGFLCQHCPNLIFRYLKISCYVKFVKALPENGVFKFLITN